MVIGNVLRRDREAFRPGFCMTSMATVAVKRRKRMKAIEWGTVRE
jgi:hypothetical protein